MRFIHLKQLVSIYITVFFLVSCDNRETICEQAPSMEDLVEEVKIERKEKELFNLSSKIELVDFMKDNPEYTREFLNSTQFPDDSTFINSLYGLINDPYVDTLYNEVSAHFKDMGKLKSDLSTAFARIKYYYPNFKAPKVQTGISGFGTDLYISDSIVVIGLDFFLGRYGSYRPQEIPEYLVKRLEEEYIVPNIVLHLSKNWNELDVDDNSFLADMIFYGKSFYFTKRVLPCTPDTLIIQFTDKELSDASENDHIIWASFLTNELLYETSHFIKRKYLEERPNIPEIGENCPGRVGVWVGWEIVEQYMSKEDITLQELMKTADAEPIFRSSRYKPNNL
ncbi:MAG: gliding motility lipoprotein GldB [Bacteroidota bacterium]